MGLDAMTFVFWMLSSKPDFSLSTLTFISIDSLVPPRFLTNGGVICISEVVIYTFEICISIYLRLMFLPAILIPAWALSNPTFPLMYSAYKLNKQSGLDVLLSSSLEPVHCSTFDSNCWFLTCIQISQGLLSCSSVGICLSIFQFLVIHTVQSSSILSEAELHVFLEFSCFFCDPAVVGSILSGSSPFSTSLLII